MKNLIIIYILTYGGALASLFDPFVGLSMRSLPKTTRGTAAPRGRLVKPVLTLSEPS